MKKLLSTILASTLLLSSLPAFAEKTDDIEGVLAKIKPRIMDTSSFENFYSEKNEGEEISYSFSWSGSKDETKDEYLYLSCSESGIITYYSYDNYSNEHDNKLSIKKPKNSEALKKAEEEFKKLNPEIADEYKIECNSVFENYGSDGYNFSLQRYKNGLKVTSDTGWMDLDSDLNMSYFYLTYSENCKFEPIDNIISKEEAKKAYDEKLTLKPTYYINETEDNKTEARLMYTVFDYAKYIDAKTGEVFEIVEDESEYVAKNAARGTAEEKAMDAGFSYAELKNFDDIGNLITSDDAENIVKNVKYFEIPTSVKPKINLNMKGNKKYCYDLYYSFSGTYAGVTLDAQTGEITSFYKYSDDYSSGDADRKTVLKESENIIKTLAPNKYSEFKLSEDTVNNNYVIYSRYVNDIPVSSNVITLSFDKNNKLTNYYINYQDCEFPSPDGILSSAEAMDKMDKKANFDIKYIKSKNVFTPVYSFDNYEIIDAFTGESELDSLGIFGAHSLDSIPEYTDIAGHYAEKQIKELAKYGIFFEGTEFHPDDVITQKDFSAVLASIFDRMPFVYYGNAEKLDACKKYFGTTDNSEQALTRLTASKLMIKAMGLEETASIDGIYKEIYSDVTTDIGYVNILTGFGVVSGDGAGHFNPDKALTRAQAFIMIYNYLNR